MIHNAKSAGVAMEMLDASGLLWRLHLDGVDTGSRFAALADADCVEAPCAWRKRVVANDPAASVLYSKIQRSAPLCGGPMPPPAEDALSPAEVTLVRDWIMAGAPND